MRTRMMVAVSAVAWLFVPGFTAAPGDSCCAHDMHRGEKMAKELGLSTQQKSQLKELRETMREAHKDQMQKMKALRDKSKEELLKPVPSKDALYAIAKESGELRRVMAEKEADHLLKVKVVLTPEQFNKLLSKDLPFGMEPGQGGPHGDKQPPEKCMREKHPHGNAPGAGPHEDGPHHEMDN
jgi:Spy/CpxP family protein refolding chaperone